MMKKYISNRCAIFFVLLCGFFAGFQASAQDKFYCFGSDSYHSAESDERLASGVALDVPRETALAIRAVDALTYRAPSVVERKDNFAFLDCDEGSLEILRTVKRSERGSHALPDSKKAYRCERGRDPGLRVDDDFQREAFPTLNACLRQIAGATADDPQRIQIAHYGIHSSRRSSNGSWSVHRYGRGMDITEVWIGDHHYRYRPARKNRDGEEWTSFWAPLIRCVQGRALAAIWEGEEHDDHLHFSLPYAHGEKRPVEDMNPW